MRMVNKVVSRGTMVMVTGRKMTEINKFKKVNLCLELFASRNREVPCDSLFSVESQERRQTKSYGMPVVVHGGDDCAGKYDVSAAVGSVVGWGDGLSQGICHTQCA
jgi:hypothetical protein